MNTEIKFQWRPLTSSKGSTLSASLGYLGSYVIAKDKRRRFTLTYATSSLCCELVGVYGSEENAKRAARRHFNR